MADLDQQDRGRALSQSRDPDWTTRCAAARSLGRFDDAATGDRLVEMLSDPDNISVIEAAAVALATGEHPHGLARIAAVYDALDEQASSFAAVAVSDAIGDTVFERLLDVITSTDDERVRDGARHLGAHIGMTTGPLWKQAFPPPASHRSARSPDG